MRSATIVAIVGMTILAVARPSGAPQASDPQPPAVLREVASVADHRDDPAIARALALLEPRGINVPVPITVVDTARPVAVRSVATAWTNGTTISVNNQGDAYRRALRGDAIPLAAALAHEAAHASGADEKAAYMRQIEVLKALGAKRSDIDDVERGARLHR